MTEPARAAWRDRLSALRAWADRHDRWLAVVFFLGGVAWDATTAAQDVARPGVLAQLAAWWALLAGALVVETAAARGDGPRAERVREGAMWAGQFGLGAVLGAVTMHFFHSASAGPSSLFLVLLGGLLVANEFAGAWLRPLWFRLGLAVAGLHAILLFAIPVLVARATLADAGAIGILAPLAPWMQPFPSPWLHAAASLGAILGGLGIGAGVEAVLGTDGRRDRLPRLAAAVLMPLLLLRGLDVLGWVPPVPLSALDVAIVHTVSSEDGPDGRAVTLGWRRPGWAVWRREARPFLAGPDDAAVCFSAIFAPPGMAVRLAHAWERWDGSAWQPVYRHTLTRPVTGGRHAGFRTWSQVHRAIRASDGTIREGWWRCRVETETGRELSRRAFWIDAVDAPPAHATRVIPAR